MKNFRNYALIFLIGVMVAGFTLTLLSATKAHGNCIIVTNLSDSGPGSLRQAIADAVTGDRIKFEVTGTINLVSGRLIVDKNLFIYGPGAEDLTVRGVDSSERIFHVASGVRVNITGITIADGHDRGGSVYGGGGIYNEGDLTLSEVILTGNSGGVSGGGGIANDGSMRIHRCTITNNHATGGGGITNMGVATVTDSEITENQAAVGGGIENHGQLSIINSTVTNNYAGAWGGGGIYNNGILDIERGTISGNTARHDNGGGVLNTSSGVLTLTYSNIFGNVATEDGPGTGVGGSIFNEGEVIIRNTTIAGNTGDVI